MSIPISLFVVQLPNEHERFLAESVRAFNSCQREFQLMRKDPDSPVHIEQELDWEEALSQYKTSNYRDECIVILTGVPFRDNWFSHSDGKLAVISTHEWFELFGRPCLQSFLLSEFALAAACHSVGVQEAILRPHEKTTGCIGDLCLYKSDIIHKLRAGYVCPEHSQLLLQLGARQSQLAAIATVLNVGRSYALGRHEDLRRYGAFTADRVFIVHGRDQAARMELEQLIRRVGLEPVAIMNEPIQGRTVIEQIEEYSGVGYAFILCTPDDEGKLRGGTSLNPRPRQNVVFEYGLFVGIVGRKRVCCIAPEGQIEVPSDLAGVLQLRYSNNITEKSVQVMDELRSVGYEVQL